MITAAVFDTKPYDRDPLQRAAERTPDDPSPLFKRARATFDRVASRLIRYGKVQYSPPRANEDGSVEIRPLRYVEPAVGTEYLARQIDRFEKYVEHVAKKGATHVSWG